MFEQWRRDGVLVRDDEDALWALEQDYTGPDGRRRTRHGFFARVGVEDYGPGRIRPHERTHPGPKEDRLRLTRATHANLSPIFSLYDDPAGAAWGALAPHLETEPWAEVTDEDGTVHRLWRVADREAIEAVRAALADAELLIADGHHRYETARVHHEEGGAGHVLMCLVALQDPGLTVFPTHRLLTEIGRPRSGCAPRSSATSRSPIATDELEPQGDGPVRMGYLDAHHRRPLMLTLTRPGDRRRGAAGQARALPGARHRGAGGARAAGRAGDERGRHLAPARARLRARHRPGARARGVRSGRGGVLHARHAGLPGARGGGRRGSMPPKSTYFFPKVLTGMVFNPLD